MINKITAIRMACLLTLVMFCQPSVLANSKSARDVAHAEKVKAGIVKLGVGQSSRVNLKLKDKTKVAGYISEIGDESFVVTDIDKGSITTVAYPDVVQVNGNNLSTRTKVIIGVAIAVGVAITLYLVRGAFCDGC